MKRVTSNELELEDCVLRMPHVTQFGGALEECFVGGIQWFP